MSLPRLSLALTLAFTLLLGAPTARAQGEGAAPPTQGAGEVDPGEDSPAPAASTRVPVIDLYTMGPGEHVFSFFGHSALCVTDAVFPRGVCYNYGTTDFSNPVQLVWDFLHGNVKFWVARDDLRRMVQIYQHYDRTVYRQRLPLSPEAAVAMAQRLAHDALPENREYLYHHFFDNCATRLRDHIDVITGGAFSQGTDASFGLSIREMVQHWTTGIYSILYLSETILARTVDPPATIWQAMFLPDVLREQVKLKMGVEPEILYQRKGPLPSGTPYGGKGVLLLLGLFSGVVAFVACRSPGPRKRRLGLTVASLPLLFTSAMIYFLVIISDVPELYLNEHILVFLPTDLVLWVARPSFLRTYARYRLILLGVVALLSAVGVLHQPVAAQIAMVALPMIAILVGLPRPGGARVAEAATGEAEAA